jgi:hypothetical protein
MNGTIGGTPDLLALARARFGIGIDLRQARLVAEALAERPYAEVHGLIGRLQAWVVRADGAPFAVAHAELVLILEALGAMPYRRVHALAGSLQRQLDAARAQAGEAA